MVKTEGPGVGSPPRPLIGLNASAGRLSAPWASVSSANKPTPEGYHLTGTLPAETGAGDERTTSALAGHTATAPGGFAASRAERCSRKAVTSAGFFLDLNGVQGLDSATERQNGKRFFAVGP